MTKEQWEESISILDMLNRESGWTWDTQEGKYFSTKLSPGMYLYVCRGDRLWSLQLCIRGFSGEYFTASEKKESPEEAFRVGYARLMDLLTSPLRSGDSNSEETTFSI
jgi:hypothetical protein